MMSGEGGCMRAKSSDHIRLAANRHPLRQEIFLKTHVPRPEYHRVRFKRGVNCITA
jgi:hypothetical protein